MVLTMEAVEEEDLVAWEEIDLAVLEKAASRSSMM